jgi:methylated-DNA-[protein]-cysteine S-methyltransferase
MLSDMNRRNEAVSQACHDAVLRAPFGRVWQALRRIPSGKVLSYGELALRLGAVRALSAMPVVPIPSHIIPCHRGAGKADVEGYTGAKSGSGMRKKHWLLAHETGR